MKIPVRRMNFKFDTKKYWYKDNPWITHYLNALSAVFPDGERFFIKSVRNVEFAVSDNNLHAEVRAFIGQEANHGKEHEEFNKYLETAHGTELSKIANFTKKHLLGRAEYASKMHQLAVTIALEHFTALLANQLLANPETMESLNTTEGTMFMWHAVEETEHKAVAYDVYEDVYGMGPYAYFTRCGVMIITTIILLAFISIFQFYLLFKDGEVFNFKAAAGFIKFLFVKPGPYTKMFGEYLDYFRPTFHPWDHDNQKLIEDRVVALEQYEIRK